jgi:hypothetical protein
MQGAGYMKTNHPETVIAALFSNGWIPDGATHEEQVLIPTTKSPRFGKCGGELATFGGRSRFRNGERYCTVGKITTCFYSKVDKQAVNFRNYCTRDIGGILLELGNSQ